MVNEIASIIEKAEAEGLFWDFYEDAENVSESSQNTIPGRLVEYLYELGPDIESANRTIGFLTTYAARRSLSCWFVYCIDRRPLAAANGLMDFWLSTNPDSRAIDPEWFQEIQPTTADGARILDCRWGDTFSASSAVTHAARFAAAHSPLDAITALSHAFIAFDVSPLAPDKFELWLSDIAYPCARARKRMSLEEQFALAAFDIPKPFLEQHE